MKVMSIIGIVWFSLTLICVFANFETDLEASAGGGMLGLLYALPFAIVGLVKSNKKQSENTTQEQSKNTTQELIALSELKEKGVLTENEFQIKKHELLNM